MKEDCPEIYGWCEQAVRVDAFATALRAFMPPDQMCTLMMTYRDWSQLSVDEIIAVLRADFDDSSSVYVSSGVVLPSGRGLGFSAYCVGEKLERQNPRGALRVMPFDKEELIRRSLDVALGGGGPSVEVEAAIGYIDAQPDIEDFMLRFCAPEGSTLVTTGGCTEHDFWGAPIEMGATYHAEAALVARDLALSWVHLHDKSKVEQAAGLSLEALHASVDAAPPGARVTVKGSGELSREMVLKALSASPAELLDALDASALPDDEWLAAEPRALETIEALKAGAPSYTADLTTGGHVRFLRRHAPYHVRRLPNGGVLLATHPYRTLWPLYKDALFLLGITP